MRLGAIAAILCILFATSAQAQEPGSLFVTGLIESVEHTGESAITVLLQQGPEAGTSARIAYDEKRAGTKFVAGERIVLERLRKIDGSVQYIVHEPYRLPALALLCAAFFTIAIIIGKRAGLMSIIGLIASIGMLTFFVVPALLAGKPPLMVCMIGSTGIATVSMYLAHGIKRRTTIALVSTFIVLSATILFATIAVRFASLFGMGSDAALFLQFGEFGNLQLQGLLLGGMVIGTLGVLDDITTAQAAAVEEIYFANTRTTAKALYASASSVGKEHIASLINTLALAYVGASLPMLLLFSADTQTPGWAILNSQFIAEELVRTLVGSTALILAVPVTTALAVWSCMSGFSRRREAPQSRHHCC